MKPCLFYILQLVVTVSIPTNLNSNTVLNEKSKVPSNLDLNAQQQLSSPCAKGVLCVEESFLNDKGVNIVKRDREDRRQDREDRRQQRDDRRGGRRDRNNDDSNSGQRRGRRDPAPENLLGHNGRKGADVGDALGSNIGGATGTLVGEAGEFIGGKAVSAYLGDGATPIGTFTGGMVGDKIGELAGNFIGRFVGGAIGKQVLSSLSPV